jgi:hypothetical protein
LCLRKHTTREWRRPNSPIQIVKEKKMNKNDFGIIDCRRRYFGVGFIKSRKSDNKVMEMKAAMIAAADRRLLKLMDIVLDQSAGVDVDRVQIDELLSWMEKEYIKAVVVRSIWDISKDVDDLISFLKKAEELNVSVYSMQVDCNLACIPWDCGEGC